MPRPPSANSIIRNLKKKQSFEPKTPIASEMYLPNVSSVQDYLKTFPLNIPDGSITNFKVDHIAEKTAGHNVVVDNTVLVNSKNIYLGQNYGVLGGFMGGAIFDGTTVDYSKGIYMIFSLTGKDGTGTYVFDNARLKMTALDANTPTVNYGFYPHSIGSETWDLGASLARWKDLYLSGDANIGGIAYVDHIAEKTGAHDIVFDDDIDIVTGTVSYGNAGIGDSLVFTGRGTVLNTVTFADGTRNIALVQSAGGNTFNSNDHLTFNTTQAGDDIKFSTNAGSIIFDDYSTFGDDVAVTGRISSGTTTITASSDTTDVSGINTLFIDITSDIVLGGLLGGVNGQSLNIVILGNFTNHVTLEHAEGIASTQDFINHTGVDELMSHGGAIYVCNGSDWYDASHARHV